MSDYSFLFFLFSPYSFTTENLELRALHVEFFFFARFMNFLMPFYHSFPFFFSNRGRICFGVCINHRKYNFHWLFITQSKFVWDDFCVALDVGRWYLPIQIIKSLFDFKCLNAHFIAYLTKEEKQTRYKPFRIIILVYSNL